MRKVLISTPVYGNRVHNLYLMGAVATAAHFGKEVGFQTFAHPVISHARNVLTKRFLEHDFENLLFIDSDIGFKKEHVEQILSVSQTGLQKHFVSGCYIRKDDTQTVPAEELGTSTTALVECSRVPAGFLLLSHYCVAQMMSKFFDDPWGLSYGNASEDYNFCARWRTLDGRIWLDKSIRLMHVGERVFSVPEEA